MSIVGGLSKNAPKLQHLGRSLILQLSMVLRTMKIHDPTNKVLLVATENLQTTINTLWAALSGSIKLQFVDGVVYLNDIRIRASAGMKEQVKHLQDEFGERGLGGLAFGRPVDSTSLRDFLYRFSRPVSGEQDIAKLKQSLMELHELAVELIDPQQFTELQAEEEQRELRIDKKTFALQTYAKSIIATREFVGALKDGREPSSGLLPITRIVQDLVDIATERVNFLLKMCAIKTADEYAYNHAANTCVLSIVLGKALKVDRLALVDLGTSALFADIGFALLPKELTEREGELTDEERVEVKDAMVRQIRSIMGSGEINNSIIRRVIVAYEHHLPFVDAEGQRKQTHAFSRIVSVADAFDALTTRRSWREGYTPDEALRILLQESGTRFDPMVVKVLVNLMGLYPLGTAVKLATGEIGLVYHNSNTPDLFEKPWVKIIQSPDGAQVRGTVIRNLAEVEGNEGVIVSVAKPDEIAVDPGMSICL